MANTRSEVQAQMRRIFLDGYGVLDVRISFFIFLRLSSKMRQPGHDDTHPATLESGLRRSQISSKLPARLNDFVLDSKVKYGLNRFANHFVRSLENFCFVSNLNKSVEPSSFEEAANDANWISAMNDEMCALYENNTWVMVDLSIRRKPIGCKWVFRIKYKSSGEIERYKARLVAKGFSQKEGIDYAETFSLVKIGIIRCLLSLAVQNDWKKFQLDINNAFLYGNLDEEVYMVSILGFCKDGDNKVCRLKKNLYGLKQTPGQWNHVLSEALIEVGFEPSKNDHSLFLINKGTISIFVLVYMGDLVITGNDLSEIEKFKSFLKNKFKIKDLGELKYFLGIEVLKTKKGLCLNQSGNIV
ncbi:putative RNA-directed DNA polymerase [Tanacetum coccineum]|uniref:RNA-directed DNA polymerase n=1 Tax=Tanacetum coccineum TaxID=301880 RepID=A0ABQ5F9V2_9ASTR